MALLEYNEIKERKIIVYENQPCEVMESHVARTQQRKPQNQVKLRSLTTGRTFTTSFQGSDKAEEADITKRDVTFLYKNKSEFWFVDPKDLKNRFKLEEKLLGDTVKFLKDNNTVTALVYDDGDEEQIISIKVPIKMEFLVKDAPPSIKGNSANSGNKPVTLENGAVISAPLFINIGDNIVVNTENGEYVERAQK